MSTLGSTFFRNALAILLFGLASCVPAEEEFPVGPCNDDGETSDGEESAGAPNQGPVQIDAPSTTTDPSGSIRPGLTSIDGWHRAEGLDGVYRWSTVEENRRFRWPDNTLVVASPFAPLDTEPNGPRAAISMPTWSKDLGRWIIDHRGTIKFHRWSVSKVQTLALGHFVEHRHALRGSGAVVRRPTFDVYGNWLPVGEGRIQVLHASTDALLVRVSTNQGPVQATYPHGSKQLDIQAPDDYVVTVVSPHDGDVARDPLTPYVCQDGICEDPNDPLDECNDGIDNDGDGHADTCDWNCLPHADFGADEFPEAASRVENGKTYAMMGGGSICTQLGDTWTVEFADMALQASELLGNIRPDVDDPVRFRVFSCWVFEDQDAFDLCQYGSFEVVDDEVINSPPICPPGMENYPYQPTETDQLDAADQANLLFEEAWGSAWVDLELNTQVLGTLGEPVSGVAFLTTDTLQTCLEDEWPACAPVAGLAYLSPDAAIYRLGAAVVTNYNPYDWHTLAHEVGHTLGLVHDTAVGGFMNDKYDGGYMPLLGQGQDNELIDNNAKWEVAFETKGARPRSSGWAHTGCSGFAECAPLGKPGWSCNGSWCLED